MKRRLLIAMGVILMAGGGPVAARPLSERLLSMKKRVRIEAYKEIEGMHFGAKRDLVPYLVEGLQDDNYQVCNVSSYALGLLGKGAYEAVPHLISTLKTRDDCPNVTFALRKIGRPAVPPLIDMLRTEEEATRHLSSKTLMKLGYAAREAIPALREILQELDEFYGIEYAPYLARIKPESVVPYLSRVITSGEFPIRKEAAMLLVQLGPAAEAAIPALTEALQEKSYYISEDWRPACATALGNFRDRATAAVDELTSALNDTNLDLRDAAAEALRKIGTPSAQKALEQFRKNG